MAQLKDITQGDGVTVKEVAAGNIIKDAKGHTWTVPMGELEDLDDLHGQFQIPCPEDGFAYQYTSEHRVREAKLRGWVTVDRDEIGIPALDEDEHGHSVTSTHQIGGLVLMKMPKPLHDRFKQAKEKRIHEELDAVSAMADTDKKVEESGLISSSKLEKSTDPDLS